MLSVMAQEFFAASNVLVWPLVALTAFVVTFVAVVIRTMSRSKASFAATAALPLCADTTRVEDKNLQAERGEQDNE